MAIDTQAKRMSCVAVGVTLLAPSPFPAGNGVDAAVRAAAGWNYSGLTFGGPVAIAPQIISLEAGLSRIVALDADLSRTVSLSAGVTRTLSLEAQR